MRPLSGSVSTTDIDRVDRRVGAAAARREERRPERVGPAQAGGVQRGRPVVDGHHRRAALCGRGWPRRRPERVVQQTTSGRRRASVRFSAALAERHAVAVGGASRSAGSSWRRAVAVALARAGDDDVVLEGAGARARTRTFASR